MLTPYKRLKKTLKAMYPEARSEEEAIEKLLTHWAETKDNDYFSVTKHDDGTFTLTKTEDPE